MASHHFQRRRAKNCEAWAPNLAQHPRKQETYWEEKAYCDSEGTRNEVCNEIESSTEPSGERGRRKRETYEKEQGEEGQEETET